MFRIRTGQCGTGVSCSYLQAYALFIVKLHVVIEGGVQVERVSLPQAWLPANAMVHEILRVIPEAQG